MGSPQSFRGDHQTLEPILCACGRVSPSLGLSFPISKPRRLNEMISELLPALKQFQDSRPYQPRLAAAQALLCTQGSCIFNFTVKGFFFSYAFSTHYRKQSRSMTTNGNPLPAIMRGNSDNYSSLLMFPVSQGALRACSQSPYARFPVILKKKGWEICC